MVKEASARCFFYHLFFKVDLFLTLWKLAFNAIINIKLTYISCTPTQFRLVLILT